MTHVDNQGTGAPMGTDVGLKALAAVGFLVEETGADLYAVMKMLYLADKAHLAEYGRTITGDGYLAMERGPVPEAAYSLWRFVRGDRAYFDDLPDAREWIAIDGNKARMKRKAPREFLSRSDLKALSDAAARYKSGGWKTVADESHDAAWQKRWAARVAGSKVAKMDIASIAEAIGDTLLIRHLADSSPGVAESPST